jgi:hypothetical protein
MLALRKKITSLVSTALTPLETLLKSSPESCAWRRNAKFMPGVSKLKILIVSTQYDHCTLGFQAAGRFRLAGTVA